MGTGAYPNDVALLKLSSYIDLVNSNQRAITMADTNDNFDNTECYITGWGLDENSKSLINIRLRLSATG